jgi:hypothetical protein
MFRDGVEGTVVNKNENQVRVEFEDGTLSDWLPVEFGKLKEIDQKVFVVIEETQPSFVSA